MTKVIFLTLACLASGWWLPTLLLGKEGCKDGFSFWTLTSLSGLLSTYFLIVVQAPLVLLWTFHGVLALSGLVCSFSRRSHWQKPPFVFIIIFFLMSVSIFLSPLRDWDARSIWFFHAKIFHFENLKITSTLADPSIGFSHPHYTHFFPMMTAYVLTPWPFWNAYIPKISIWLLWIPMWFGFLALTKDFLKHQQIYFGLALFGIPGSLLWNGYMDGYLAGFFVLGTLALTQYFENPSNKKGWIASLFYAICILLKQEGLALVALACMATSFHYRRLQKWTNLWFLAPVIFAFVMYLWVKKQIPVTDYLLNAASPLTYFSQRIFDSTSIGLLGKYLFKYLWNVFVFFVALRYCFGLPKSSWNLFSIIAVLYTLLLCFIYISTSFDLNWYLETTTSRTLVVVKLLWLLSLVLSLKPPLRGNSL